MKEPCGQFSRLLSEAAAKDPATFVQSIRSILDPHILDCAACSEWLRESWEMVEAAQKRLKEISDGR